MMELLSPAGGWEAMVAAVQNGADAVYMGFGGLNARRSARNFTDEEFREAVAYCHLRGVKVYLTLNTLVTDRELPAAAEALKKASDMGVDAILIQDWGIWRLAREIAPDVPLHASTQMSLHTLGGACRAAELGLIVLSHSGLDVGFPGVVHVTPRMVRSALDQVGPMTLILAHMGGWRNWDQVEELLPDTSVYLDTSYSLGDLAPLDDGFYLPEDLPMMPQEQFLRMVRTFGPHRILFGTDSPWQSQTDAVAAIRALPLSQEEQDGILGGNAQKLLNFPNM